MHSYIGTYDTEKPTLRADVHVSIRCIGTTLNVITSKQRPRKLSITGDNGKEYMFLLKGRF